MRKVIFHIDELSKWQLTISNVYNMINNYNTIDYIIEILINSEAVKELTSSHSKFKDELLVLLSKNVNITACQNSLNGYNISTSELLAGVKTTPSGVVHLAEMQFDGFAYIKP